MTTPLPPLQLSLQFSPEHRARLDPKLHLALTRHQVRQTLRHALRGALAHPSQQHTSAPSLAWPALLGVRVVGEVEGLALNQDFRQQAHATNVLTFAYGLSPQIWADVVLCAPVLKREARELGVSLKSHCTHLLVHACLHALGFDHEGARREAQEMEALETLILKGLGVADPYARAQPAKQPSSKKRSP